MKIDDFRREFQSIFGYRQYFMRFQSLHPSAQLSIGHYSGFCLHVVQANNANCGIFNKSDRLRKAQQPFGGVRAVPGYFQSLLLSVGGVIRFQYVRDVVQN
jgi:hypothetical protein